MQTMMPPPHHQQSPHHHHSNDRTNLPMKLPSLRQSVCKHKMILQTILPDPSCKIVIGLWIHFLIQAVILHQCIIDGMRMMTCTHIGCSTMVHPPCHVNWLKRHCYMLPPCGQHVCRQHSSSYQLWVRFKAGIIPGSENGCIPGSEAAAR